MSGSHFGLAFAALIAVVVIVSRLRDYLPYRRFVKDWNKTFPEHAIK